MATIGQFYIDLIDAFKRSGSDDELKRTFIIETLARTNRMLEDAMTVECNLGTRHRTTLRDKLPEGTWRKLYQGIAQEKSGTTQVEDTTGMISALSSIDKDLIDLSGEQGDWLRLSEATAFIEGLGQSVASALIYANDALEPEKFTGFAARYNSLSDPLTGGQIVDGGGTGADNTSVWFVTWGDNQCHLIHPKGTPAGLRREDKGQQRVLDASGNPYYVMEELFSQNVGLSVRDPRHVARIANIDSSDLAAGTVDIYALMRRAFWKIRQHNLPNTRMAIYCNADVLEALDADATPTKSTQSGTGDSFVRLKPMEIQGKEVMAYRGIPVRQMDAILNNEAQVT